MYKSISRFVFKFVKQRGGVCDLPRFLILENSVNLKHHIDCRIGLLFAFYWSNIKLVKLFIPDNGVKIQVFVLTHEFEDRMTELQTSP